MNNIWEQAYGMPKKAYMANATIWDGMEDLLSTNMAKPDAEALAAATKPPKMERDMSGFANYGMNAPQLGNMPFSPMVNAPLTPAPQIQAPGLPQAPGLMSAPTPQVLPLMNPNFSANIPELRRGQTQTIIGLGGQQKRQVPVKPSKLAAYLSSLGVANG
jgi:hypothetical protein